MNIFKFAFEWLKNKIFDKKIIYANSKSLKSDQCSCGKGTLTIYRNHGLCEIKYDYVSGGPIGGGISITGHGTKEYQFHYNACTNPDCNNWEMVEYRQTPSWIDDLFNIDCPFYKGDIIKLFKDGKIDGKTYTSHKITRW